MKLYLNTSIYQETEKTVSELLKILKREARVESILKIIERKLVKLTSLVALALEEDDVAVMDSKLNQIEPKIKILIQLINFATYLQLLKTEQESKMEELLKKEGIIVKDDVIVDFSKKFWDPSRELTL